MLLVLAVVTLLRWYFINTLPRASSIARCQRSRHGSVGPEVGHRACASVRDAPRRAAPMLTQSV